MLSSPKCPERLLGSPSLLLQWVPGAVPLPLREVEGRGRGLSLTTRLHLVLKLRRMELHLDSPVRLHGTVVNYAQGELILSVILGICITRSIPLSQKEMKLVQQMKQSVQNTVMSYQKIYERKKRKEKKYWKIAKEVWWEERKDVRRTTHTRKLQRFTVLVPRYKNLFPLIWIIISTQKSHKLRFTWDLCRSYGTALYKFLIAIYLFFFAFRENSENGKFFTQGDVKESMFCFHLTLQVCHKHSERFVPRHQTITDHSHFSYETTYRLWDQYHYLFFVFGSVFKTPTTPLHPVLFFS